MSEFSAVSFLSNINWSDLWQWYSNHISTDHLIRNWEGNALLTQNDWLTILLLIAHLLLLLGLGYSLINRHTQAKFHALIESRRTLPTRKPTKKSHTILEAKVADSPLLKQTYNLHRYAMYDQALSKYKEALHASPDDINVYLVGIKIISEMDVPDSNFIQFVQNSFGNLRRQHPSLWKEVARYGDQKAPHLYHWQPAVN